MGPRIKATTHLLFTPDGRRVLLSHAKGGELVVLDAAARQEIKRIKVGGQFRRQIQKFGLEI